MTPRDEHGSELSAQRAFVVHLAPGTGSGRRRFRGRVEHLPSGESAHFSSLESLLAFFTAVLDGAAASASPEGKDGRRGRAPSEPSRPARRRADGGPTPSTR